MRLRTLGGLELPGSPLRQPKPLVLLAYLALEGPQERGRLSRVFWARAADPRNQLSQALSQLRRALPGVISADRDRVSTSIRADVHDLLDALDAGDLTSALALHAAPFLADVSLRNPGHELEEWLYDTRENLASRLRSTLVDRAEALIADRDRSAAIELGELAHGLGRVADPDPEMLLRLHTVLLAARSPRANDVRLDAAPFGLPLAATSAAADARLRSSERRTTSSALPVRRTSFVGRVAELTRLSALLDADEHRLVTITGFGGVGKSRLALELAHRAATMARFADGVSVVPLDDVRTTEEMLARLAQALGIVSGQDGERHSAAQVAAQLDGRRALVILDDVTDVDGAAEAITALLRADGLHLVVTSRARLQVEGETNFPLSGLAGPEEPDRAGGAPSDAARLFVDRARRVEPRVRLDDVRDAVDALCALTEGSPLALELAAAWVDVLPVPDLVAEIGANLDLLATSVTDVDDRHRSIRGVFEQSWSRLGREEQAVMRQLAVFRGGFRREAAAAVAGASLGVLSSLTRASLLRLSPSGRYDRHPLVLAFTRELLAAAPDEEASVVERHTAWYREAVVDWTARVFGPDHEQVFGLVAEELPNVIAAWAHAVDRLDAGSVLDLSTVFAYLRFVGRPADAVRHWQDARLAFERWRPDAKVLIGTLLAMESAGRAQLHQSAAARALAERSVAMLRPLGARWGLRDALLVLARDAGDRGDIDAARRHREELDALQVAEHRGMVHQSRGALLLRTGAYEAARTAFAEGARLSRERGDRGGEMACLSGLAAASTCVLDLDRAERSYHELRSLSDRRVGSYEELALFGLGRIALLRHDADEAERLGRQLRRYVRDEGDASFVAGGDALLAGAALLHDDHELALERCRRAISREGGPTNPAVHWFTMTVTASLLRAVHDVQGLTRLLDHAREHGEGWPFELACIEAAATDSEEIEPSLDSPVLDLEPALRP